jgi:hypothetical protein
MSLGAIKEGDDIKDYYVEHNKPLAYAAVGGLGLLGITIVGGVALGLAKKPFVMIRNKIKEVKK